MQTDSSKKTALSRSDKRNDEMGDTKNDDKNNYNKNKGNNARTSNDYRPLSSVSDDLDMSRLRGGGGGHMHGSSVTQTQQGKRTKTEIVTQGRRHNFEIQPSRYRGSSHTHLGQLPSIEGTGSAAAASKPGYNSEYA